VLDAMDVSVESGLDALPTTPSVVADCLVGYGLSGPLRGTAAAMVEHLDDDATTVSLDVPTGRNTTTGAEPGPAITADRVVTLALPKTGLVGLDCPVALADIGIPAVVYDRLGIPYGELFAGEYLVDLVEV
jgi:NAD(P)H-hydrate epimerase